jgi:hypothetical protein
VCKGIGAVSTDTTATDDPERVDTGAAAGVGGQPDHAGAPRRLQWRAWLIPVMVVGATIGVLVPGMWVSSGPSMEEGFMLVFPERTLAGDVANRDFLHLYGPGSLWLLAAVYWLLEVDLWVERLVGLAQLIALIGGVTLVGMRWGRWVATVAGATTAIVILPPVGMVALAWVGGVALALWAVIVAVGALDLAAESGNEPRRHRRLFLAGALGGLGLLFRPDLAIALGLPLGLLWLRALERPERRWLLTGALGGVSPYLIHVAMAGPGNVVRGLIIEPVFDLRPGRSLGFPPSWDSYDSYLGRLVAFRNWPWPLPNLAETNQLFLWALILPAACAVLLIIGIYARRAGSADGLRLLALGLFAVGTLPQAIQRPDATHLAWVSAVPFGLLPVAFAEWVRLRGGAPRVRAPATLVPLIVMLALIPSYTVRWYADYVGQTFGYRRDSHEISHRDRTFYYGQAEVADAAGVLLNDVERLTSPGERLVVGPGDFRRTPYSEAYLYFLLPQLVPGTHYIEMDPGIANAPDSGLAEDLEATDVVILSTIYDAWEEPNTSVEDGSDEPDRVLEEHFCLHDRYGSNPDQPGRGYYELYLRC